MAVDGRTYYAHRLAWFYVYGRWPEHQIDHINGVKSDNRVTNLREATSSQNMANTGLTLQNRSGFKGVGWHKVTSKWQARIRVDGKMTHLGLFETPEAAFQAYTIEAKALHGEFARLA